MTESTVGCDFGHTKDALIVPARPIGQAGLGCGAESSLGLRTITVRRDLNHASGWNRGRFSGRSLDRLQRCEVLRPNPASGAKARRYCLATLRHEWNSCPSRLLPADFFLSGVRKPCRRDRMLEHFEGCASGLKSAAWIGGEQVTGHHIGASAGSAAYVPHRTPAASSLQP